jgi:hypothetical protein
MKDRLLDGGKELRQCAALQAEEVLTLPSPKETARLYWHCTGTMMGVAVASEPALSPWR